MGVVSRLACLLVLFPSGGLAAPPAFSGQGAMQRLAALCALGPRVPGTAAHDAARQFLIAELSAAGATVLEEHFIATPPRYQSPVDMTNIIGRFDGRSAQRLVLAAHWDSRPWADAEEDSSLHDTPVLGANDSASGCAILLELAAALGRELPPYGVDLVFFDGEDSGLPGVPRSFCLGSQEYARGLVEPPLYAVVLDMVGDKELSLRREAHAARLAPDLQEYVWQRAASLALPGFADPGFVEIYDDHVPLLEAGVPAVDLIDFDYPHWHTTADTPDKCSAASLQVIGELVTSLVYNP